MRDGLSLVVETSLFTGEASCHDHQVILGDSKTVSVSFEKIKRVFFQDQLVEAYMGRIFGWASCKQECPLGALTSLMGHKGETRG